MAVIHVFVLTAAETESQSEVATEEDLSVDTKLCNLENELSDSTTLQEVCENIKNCNLRCS